MQINEKIKKILLVDDDIDLLEVNKIQIEARGFEVVTAESAKEGWDQFKKEKPDAVILDLIMEHHDSGFVLSHKIKKDEHGRHIPVYILTSATYDTGFKFGASTNEEKQWIKCDGILNKPVVVEEMLLKMEKFFED